MGYKISLRYKCVRKHSKAGNVYENTFTNDGKE